MTKSLAKNDFDVRRTVTKISDESKLLLRRGYMMFCKVCAMILTRAEAKHLTPRWVLLRAARWQRGAPRARANETRKTLARRPVMHVCGNT